MMDIKTIIYKGRVNERDELHRRMTWDILADACEVLERQRDVARALLSAEHGTLVDAPALAVQECIRAEKAEAEVERLERELVDLRKSNALAYLSSEQETQDRLIASEAEVKRLQAERDRFKTLYDERKAAAYNAVIRAERAEAKVERLRGALEQAPEPVNNYNRPFLLDLPTRESYVYWYINTRSKALYPKPKDEYV